MSDHPQYPTYPGEDQPPGTSGPTPAGPPVTPPMTPPVTPPVYGQEPPLDYGRVPIPPPGQPYPAPGRLQPPSSTKAVWALVLGIVSLALCYLGALVGPAAIVVALQARQEIDAHPLGAVSGRGMATAGLVTGIIGTVFWIGIDVLTVVGLTVA